MDDGECVNETPSRRNEWEFVSLSASAHAAAPDPDPGSRIDEHAFKDSSGDGRELETSCAMFMSGHFIFPPSQHENLPVQYEPHGTNVHREHVGNHANVLKEDKFCRTEEIWDIEGLTVEQKFPGSQFFNENGTWLKIRCTEFDEGFNMLGRDSFHEGGSTKSDEKQEVPDLTEPSEQGLNFPAFNQLPKPREDDNYVRSHLSYWVWWKRQAACLYAHAKEGNSFWSICIAAAAMGLLIVGHQWGRERQ